MVIDAGAATPIGLAGALPALTHPLWLAWDIGVGLCSSVIPYVTDQLAMARLPRATFALMLGLLPAAATVIGLAILTQVPNPGRPRRDQTGHLRHRGTPGQTRDPGREERGATRT